MAMQILVYCNKNVEEFLRAIRGKCNFYIFLKLSLLRDANQLNSSLSIMFNPYKFS
jgi:hypothetical protein